MGEIILVQNLAEIQRDLAKASPLIARGLHEGLIAAAEPVKRDAERLSRSQISGMKRAKRKPPPWSIQRIGATRREVYIVPRQRGTKSRTDRRRRRPNFAVLMLGKSYEPALERNRTVVRETVDYTINTVMRTL